MKSAAIVLSALLTFAGVRQPHPVCYEAFFIDAKQTTIALNDSGPQPVELDFIAHPNGTPEVPLEQIRTIPVWPRVLVCTTRQTPENRGGP